MAIEYDIYSGDHAGGPVDYSTPAATVTGLAWTGPALPPSSTTRFAVRARDTSSGLSELNTDAVVAIAVSAAGADLGGLPRAPVGLRATATAGGSARVEWAYPSLRGPRPTGFRVYGDGGTGTVSYGTVLATVAWAGPGTTYRAAVAGLADGTPYLFVVRAYNATGEESNAATAGCTAVASPPASPTGLTATPTSRAR